MGVPDGVFRARTLMRDARRTGESALFDEAERLLLADLESTGGHAEVLIGLGDLVMERGHLAVDQLQPRTPIEEAGVWYEKALEKDPENRDALRGLSTWNELSGNPQAALSVDKQLLALSPDDLQALVHTGRSELEAGSYAAAEITLRRAQEQWHRVAEERGESFDRATELNTLLVIHELLGRSLMKMGRDSSAETILREAVVLVETESVEGPRDIVACPYVALGTLYRAQGRDEETADMLMKAADLEPHKRSIQSDAAVKAYFAGDFDAALVYVRRALAAGGGEPELDVLLAQIERARAGEAKGEVASEVSFDAALRAFERYDHATARTFLNAALKSTEPSLRYSVLDGFLGLLERDTERVSWWLEETRSAAMSDPGTEVVKGHLELAGKDYASAEATFARVVDQLVDSPHYTERWAYSTDGYEWVVSRMALLGMAWTQANQNRHDAARRPFEQILRYKPTDTYALLGLANSENALGNFPRARELLESILVRDPENPYALAELALVRLNQGDEEEAEQRFKAALAAEPETYTCPYEGLGLVYLRQGKTEAAEKNFERAIAINPDIEFKKYNGLARIYIDQGKLDEAAALLEKSIENHPWDDEARTLMGTIEKKRSGR